MSASRRLLEKKSVFPEIFSAVFLRSPCDITFSIGDPECLCNNKATLSRARENEENLLQEKHKQSQKSTLREMTLKVVCKQREKRTLRKCKCSE